MKLYRMYGYGAAGAFFCCSCGCCGCCCSRCWSRSCCCSSTDSGAGSTCVAGGKRIKLCGRVNGVPGGTIGLGAEVPRAAVDGGDPADQLACPLAAAGNGATRRTDHVLDRGVLHDLRRLILLPNLWFPAISSASSGRSTRTPGWISTATTACRMSS